MEGEFAIKIGREWDVKNDDGNHGVLSRLSAASNVLVLRPFCQTLARLGDAEVGVFGKEAMVGLSLWLHPNPTLIQRLQTFSVAHVSIIFNSLTLV